MMWVWVLAIAFVGILGVVAYWFGVAYLEAWYDVKNKPREDMFWCSHGHGMIRKKHAIDLGYTQVCPICYRDALQKAEQS